MLLVLVGSMAGAMSYEHCLSQNPPTSAAGQVAPPSSDSISTPPSPSASGQMIPEGSPVAASTVTAPPTALIASFMLVNWQVPPLQSAGLPHGPPSFVPPWHVGPIDSVCMKV